MDVRVFNRPFVGFGSLEDYVHQLKRTINDVHKDGDLTILAGHSMGGLISQYAAEGDPRVSCVWLLASVPVPRFPLKGQIWWRLPRYLWWILTGKPFALRQSDSEALLLHHKQSPGAWKDFGPASGTATRQMMFRQFFGRRPKLDCRVEMVCGTDDAIISQSVQQAHAQYHGSNLRLIEGAGHMLCDSVWAKDIAKMIAAELPPMPLSKAAE